MTREQCEKIEAFWPYDGKEGFLNYYSTIGFQYIDNNDEQWEFTKMNSEELSIKDFIKILKPVGHEERITKFIEFLKTL